MELVEKPSRRHWNVPRCIVHLDWRKEHVEDEFVRGVIVSREFVILSIPATNTCPPQAVSADVLVSFEPWLHLPTQRCVLELRRRLAYIYISLHTTFNGNLKTTRAEISPKKPHLQLRYQPVMSPKPVRDNPRPCNVRRRLRFNCPTAHVIIQASRQRHSAPSCHHCLFGVCPASP